MKDVHLLYRKGHNAIYYKDLERDLENIEFYSNTLCVVYIESGQECITTSDNHNLTLKSGSATILPQGLHLHSDYVKSTQNLKAFLVFYEESIIRDFLKVPSPSKSLVPFNNEIINISGGEALKNYFKAIKTLQTEGLNEPCLIRIKQFELLHLLNLKAHQPIQLFLKSVLLKRNPKRNLQRLLNEHPVHHLTVSDLASLSGRSPSSFNRDFRATYHQSPKQWLQDKRLDHASELLIQNISVTQVATELGYDNTSHFITSFKKRNKITPKQFQKNNEN